MRARYAFPTLALTAAFAALAGLAPGADDGKKDPPPKFTPEQVQFYEKQVRPLLRKNCYECHAGKMRQSGLKLDSRAALAAGGDSGPALDPKDPAGSLL